MENENKGAVRVEGNKTPRLTFSVSREFESILPEIESMPNMSRFVCEAIYEKLQRTKNPNKDLEDALSHFVQIQSIIGRPVPQEPSQPQWTPPVQTPTRQPSHSSIQQEYASSSTELKTEQDIPSVQPVTSKQEEVTKEKVEPEETIKHSLDTETSSDSQPEEEVMITGAETVNQETITSTSHDKEDNPKEDVVMNKLRNTYLKSRASQ